MATQSDNLIGDMSSSMLFRIAASLGVVGQLLMTVLDDMELAYDHAEGDDFAIFEAHGIVTLRILSLSSSLSLIVPSNVANQPYFDAIWGQVGAIFDEAGLLVRPKGKMGFVK